MNDRMGSAADSSSIRIVFAGDILLSRNVAREIEATGRGPWDSLASLLRSADLAIGNLEGALGDSSGCLQGKEGPCFPIREALLDHAVDAGFDVLGLANNHAMDLGPAGLERTNSALRRRGLLPASSDGSPWFLPIRGRTIALVAINLVPGRDGVCQAIPSPEVARKMRTARAYADHVVAFIHWGRELQDWPDPSQVETARWLVLRGADLIVGSHPHVVQGPAWVDGVPVFYSLGNHVFDQKYPETKRGLLADCRFDTQGIHCETIATLTTPGTFRPVAGHREDLPPRPSGTNPIGAAERPLGGVRIENSRDGRGSRFVSDSASGPRWTGPWRDRESAAMFTAADGSKLVLSLERHFSPLDGRVSVRPYVYGIGKRGLIARWRGSGLAWPLLDAGIPDPGGDRLCALHSAGSFLSARDGIPAAHAEAYRWNGFGFTLEKDGRASALCAEFFR